MRNRIPEVAEAAVIKDFYRGFNDSAFVQAIIQKVPITSEQLLWEAGIYHRGRASPRLHWGRKARAPSAQEGHEPATRQALGQEALGRGAYRWATGYSGPRCAPWWGTDTG
jgi:hypothetical protein